MQSQGLQKMRAPLIKAILSNCVRVCYVFVGQHVLFFCAPRYQLFVFCACRKKRVLTSAA